MANAVIEIRDEGLDQAIASLEGAAEAMRDPDLKLAIARYFSSEAKNRFDTKTAPDGSTWKKSNENPDTLVLSGTLRGSISEEIVGDTIFVGSRGMAAKPYAAAHQFGVTLKPVTAKALAFTLGDKFILAKQVTLPARPYIGVAGRDRAVVVGMLVEAISGGMQ
jgi:phage gpG-like protein